MHRNALFLAFCLCWAGCEADDPCDKDQVYEQGRCTAPTTDSGADGADAASYAGDAASCDENLSKALGLECTDASGCNCAAPYCAIMPGQTKGVCTRTCSTMPDDCPDGYRCFDLSFVGVTGIDPFCIAE